jgi:hypothetical protein
MHTITPEEFKVATRSAVKVYQTAFEAENETVCKNVAVYRDLDPVRDKEILRLSSEYRKMESTIFHRPFILHHEEREKEMAKESITSLQVRMMIWSPDHSIPLNHPDFMDVISQVASAPRPISDGPMEGMKRLACCEVPVDVNDQCPFHRQMGVKGKTFGECCQNHHARRKIRNSNEPHQLCYDPFDQAGARHVEGMMDEGAAAARNGMIKLDLFGLLRVSYIATARYRISSDSIELVKKRLDRMDCHAVTPSQWFYKGCFPVVMHGIGLLAFRDIDLDIHKCSLPVSGLTAQRLSAMICLMKDVCTGIRVVDASIEAEPYQGTKPDPLMLTKNRDFLVEGLDLESPDPLTIKKKSFTCAYWGTNDQRKLSRCACKKVHYCSKEHQRKHWKDHKPECSAVPKSRRIESVFAMPLLQVV